MLYLQSHAGNKLLYQRLEEVLYRLPTARKCTPEGYKHAEQLKIPYEQLVLYLCASASRDGP